MKKTIEPNWPLATAALTTIAIIELVIIVFLLIG